MTNFDPIVERIAQIEGIGDTPRPEQPAGQPGVSSADHDERGPNGGSAGPSAAGASPPPEDLAEVEEFLLDGLMGAIEWAYESRAEVAGPHWKLTEPEAVTIRKPAARVVAKWAPKLVAFVPGFALRFKDEVALCMVLVTITRGRVKIDRQREAAAEPPTLKGQTDAKTE
jgi:hypothetical protein